MIEIKVIVSPETNDLLSQAQALTGIARKDISTGALLVALLRRKTAAEVAQVMTVGMPGMMKLIDAEIASAAERLIAKEKADKSRKVRAARLRLRRKRAKDAEATRKET